MLAYIFWHWPYPEVESGEYERDEVAFLQALVRASPAGFQGCSTSRIGEVPWITGQARRYEDWYLVDDFAALGPLNDAIVAEPCRELHNRVAQAAAAGAGGLYRLRAGQPKPSESYFASWIAKDRQTSYDDFYAQLDPIAQRPGVSLWRRQMVLGPAPEFCLLSAERPELPPELQALVVTRELLPV